MKKIFTFISIITFSLAANAQNADAVVFSENGDKFTLILNGEKQNQTPQTNVKVKGLTGEFYQARIDFEDASLPDFTNKNFAVHKGYEVTYVIKNNKKGEYVLRFQGEAEIGGGGTAAPQPSAPSTQVVDYVIEETSTPAPAPKSTTVTTTAPQVTTTTTTTTTTAKPNGEKVNVNMNVGGVNMGINMNIEGMDSDVVIEETTTTVKSTSTSTNTSTQVAQPSTRQEVVVVEKTPAGCSRPMDASAFSSAKSSISSKGFDDTKLSTAKNAVKANCMSTTQIKEVMGLFGFEETKLDFAKYAYEFCTDKNNYYTVGDTFSFSTSADELNEFLESK